MLLQVPPNYDSLLGKLIVWAEDRPAAINRMRRALNELVISGVPTTVQYHTMILDLEDFQKGNVDTGFIPSHAEELKEPPPSPKAVGMIPCGWPSAVCRSVVLSASSFSVMSPVSGACSLACPCKGESCMLCYALSDSFKHGLLVQTLLEGILLCLLQLDSICLQQNGLIERCCIYTFAANPINSLPNSSVSAVLEHC